PHCIVHFPSDAPSVLNTTGVRAHLPQNRRASGAEHTGGQGGGCSHRPNSRWENRPGSVFGLCATGSTMSYAIDLTARQSSRILEQALRHRAGIVLEPRVFNEEESLCGHLDAALPPGNS